MHGFAVDAGKRKEYLYRLKDAGIAYAYMENRIEPVAINGGWVKYRGEGYCFHSSLLPADVRLDRRRVSRLRSGIHTAWLQKSPAQGRGIFFFKSLPPLPDWDFVRIEVPRRMHEDGGNTIRMFSILTSTTMMKRVRPDACDAYSGSAY